MVCPGAQTWSARHLATPAGPADNGLLAASPRSEGSEIKVTASGPQRTKKVVAPPLLGAAFNSHPPLRAAPIRGAGVPPRRGGGVRTPAFAHREAQSLTEYIVHIWSFAADQRLGTSSIFGVSRRALLPSLCRLGYPAQKTKDKRQKTKDKRLL